MGIMLLLTLILCMQIVQNPGIADISHDAKALSKLTAASRSLQADLQLLQIAVQANERLFNSGGLINAEILRSQMDEARLANQRAERDMQELVAQTDEANAVAEQLEAFAAASSASQETDGLKVTISEAKRVLEQLERGKRVLYNRPPGSNECWLVEVSTETDVRAGVIGKKEAPKSFSSIEHCRDWMLAKRSSADFLIVIKPQTWDLKAPLEKVCQESQVTYAFDLLPQNKIALDETFGAGF